MIFYRYSGIIVSEKGITMLKDYLKSQKLSISRLSQMTGIPYSTLNDIVNGKTDLDRVAYGSVKRLAAALSQPITNLELLCGKALIIDDTYSVIIKNKAYYLSDSKSHQLRYLFKINPLNSEYLDFAVQCLIDEDKSMRELEEKWANSII